MTNEPVISDTIAFGDAARERADQNVLECG